MLRARRVFGSSVCRSLPAVAALFFLSPVLAADRVVRIATLPSGRLPAVVAVAPTTAISQRIELRVQGDGTIRVPTSLPLAWEISAEDFEPAFYDAVQLLDGAPIVLRALGRIAGAVKGIEPGESAKKFVWLALRAGNWAPRQDPVVFDGHRFAITVPAGVYRGVLSSRGYISKIQAGVVVTPGATTNLREIQLERCRTAKIRAVDSLTKRPIAGAAVTWSPRPGINVEIARELFHDLWSGKTDSKGEVTLTGLGSSPLAWIVEAKGYQPGGAEAAPGNGPGMAIVPAVELRPALTVVVTLRPPSDAPLPDLDIAIAIPTAQDSLRFKVVATKPFSGAPVSFPNQVPGRKRVLALTRAGKTLAFYDTEISDDDASVDLVPRLAHVYGTVRRSGHPLTGALVDVTDPHDPETKISTSQPTDDNGGYDLHFFQAGKLLLTAYAAGDGLSPSEGRWQMIDAPDLGRGDEEVDFDLPGARLSLTVLDQDSGMPVPGALVKSSVSSEKGITTFLADRKTDEFGKISFVGLDEGSAVVFVQARGYRAKKVEAATTPDTPDVKVWLEPSPAVDGVVVSPFGQPVVGASIRGGYGDAESWNPEFSTTSDEAGHFQFASAPASGVPFYVTAGGYALAICSLVPGSNTIMMSYPSAPAVYVVAPTGMPLINFRVVATVANGALVPEAVLDTLARANGLSEHDLLALTPDGHSVLSAFLPPGQFDFYVTLLRPGGFSYQKLGTAALPASEPTVFTFQPPQHQ
jgi:hypothetical protein